MIGIVRRAEGGQGHPVRQACAADLAGRRELAEAFVLEKSDEFMRRDELGVLGEMSRESVLLGFVQAQQTAAEFQIAAAGRRVAAEQVQQFGVLVGMAHHRILTRRGPSGRPFWWPLTGVPASCCGGVRAAGPRVASLLWRALWSLLVTTQSLSGSRPVVLLCVLIHLCFARPSGGCCGGWGIGSVGCIATGLSARSVMAVVRCVWCGCSGCACVPSWPVSMPCTRDVFGVMSSRLEGCCRTVSGRLSAKAGECRAECGLDVEKFAGPGRVHVVAQGGAEGADQDQGVVGFRVEEQA